MMNSTRLIVGAALAVGLVGPASAMVIGEHVGSTNPETEGFVRGGGTTTFGVAAGPTPAWNVKSTRTGGPNYRDDTTAAENLAAFTDGWVMTADVRVNPDATSGDYLPLENGDLGTSLEYGTDASSGSQRWFLSFGAEANGDPQVRVGFTSAHSTYTVTGGAGAYNLYELKYDPLADSADLFVNGVEVLSNLSEAQNNTLSRFAFGGNNGGSSQPPRSADFALVRLETVPEPSSLGLLGLTGAVLLARRRRCSA